MGNSEYTLVKTSTLQTLIGAADLTKDNILTSATDSLKRQYLQEAIKESNLAIENSNGTANQLIHKAEYTDLSELTELCNRLNKEQLVNIDLELKPIKISDTAYHIGVSHKVSSFSSVSVLIDPYLFMLNNGRLAASLRSLLVLSYTAGKQDGLDLSVKNITQLVSDAVFNKLNQA